MDCCNIKTHLVIIGGGSAAFAATIRALELNARVTMINAGLPIGGTCVNVGCVPSKTLIRAAEAFHKTKHTKFPGIETKSRINDFRSIIEQKRKLVAQLRTNKYINILPESDDFRLIEGFAKFIDPKIVEVNGERISADKIIIAPGASPKIPAIEGLDKTPYLTNETAFELEEIPESLIVLGGRYIALETAQMFSRFGTRVVVLQRSKRILPTETVDITDKLTYYLIREGISVVTDVSIEKVKLDSNLIHVDTTVKGARQSFEATHLLVATGRKPNTSGLGLEDTGIKTDNMEYLAVNDFLQSSLDHVYGAGDVIGAPMFVYTAAYEGKLAAENALTATQNKRDYTAMPWVIFTDPQIAGVGLDENQAKEHGIDVDVATLPLSEVPRALAANDTRGFIKLIREQKSDVLVGARILAPEGAELLMEVALAIKHGITVEQIKKMFHPYLTLSEGIKLAAIAFSKDVTKLSCCAT